MDMSDKQKKSPVIRATRLFREFFESERAGGLLLIACTLISLIAANSIIGEDYIQLWESKLGGTSISHWINDALMAVFFLLVGLELEREVYIGELSNIRNASLPIAAALGGMLVPAGIHLALNFGLPTSAGAGVPMATDIAFAIGVLSLLGNKVPIALKIFLTALAVIDDLGAILVIAIFYSGGVDWLNLGISLGIFGFLLLLNRMKVLLMWPYLIAGVFMWYFMHHSGIHATISGVLLAFAMPFGDGKKNSTSYKLQHALHTPVAFVILPLFALANTAVVFEPGWQQEIFSLNSLGIALGLLLGKPIGVVLFSALAVRFKISQLPQGIRLTHIAAVGILAGIGFTMSIFIIMLAYTNPSLIASSKLAVLFASFTAGGLGYFVLNFLLQKKSGKRKG